MFFLKRRQRPNRARQGPVFGAPWSGEQVDLDRYWFEAWADLRLRQQKLVEEFGLANAAWVVNQETGLIEFERTDGGLVRAPVQIIGTWNPKNEVFSWAWGHPSVQTRLRAAAERTRWFGDAHNVEDLQRLQVKVSEEDAWRLAAVAMKVNGEDGVYRGPTEGPVIFMTLRDMRVVEE